METWNEIIIDERKKEDIIKEIERLAKAYTPEWHFSYRDPDAGSVIAMIFAQQTADNIRRMNRMLGKYHVEFANMYGLSLRPARPASTVAVIHPVETVSDGVPFYKGTQMLGETEDGKEIVFEAMQDLYVTGAKLTDARLVFGREQKMIPLFGEFFRQNLLTGELESAAVEKIDGEVTLFSKNREGIGEQAVLLAHRFLFDAEKGPVCLRFCGIDETLAAQLADGEQYQFFYLTESGLAPYEEVRAENGLIFLTCYGKGRKHTYNGIDYSVIILRQISDVCKPFVVTGIEIVTENLTEEPDFIYDGVKELEKERFLPFGHQPALYQECYLGKAPWLEQGGTVITMKFRLTFEKFQQKGTSLEDKNLKIIKRKPRSVEKTIQYDSFVQEISLEYFNGSGWKKMMCSPSIDTLFGSEENEGTYEISFEVPEDWEPTSQGGYEQQCIRLQVKRADNCYISDAVFHYPVISNFSLELSCRGGSMCPERIERISGIERENLLQRLRKAEQTELFTATEDEGDYLYLGFDRKFGEEPVSIFFELAERIHTAGIRLEYSGSVSSGFQKLRIADGTQNFAHTGNVVLVPPPNQEKRNLDGVERYWIRIEDKGASFRRGRYKKPVLKNIFLNAVEIENVETGEEEDYFLDEVRANMSFPLYADNILSAEVWVNEKDRLSIMEMEKMKRKMPECIRIEYNFLGEIEEFFVRWSEVEHFDETAEQARVYMIERGTGQLIFGDGVCARIPQNTKSVAFKVRLTRCSGKAGNLAVGRIAAFRGKPMALESIRNPIAAFGGNDPESFRNALSRGSCLMSARKRLVSEVDYIREAKIFSEEIYEAACIAGQSRAAGKRDGVISLVLLMSEYKKGSYAFRSIETALKEHMIQQCEMTCLPENLEIVEPIFVKISVHVWLGIQRVEDSMEIQDFWRARMEEYLEPVKGIMHGGWKIGTLPGENQIRMMLNALETDAVLQHFSVQAIYQDETGVHETSLDSIPVSPFMVCCNGTHRIIVSEI